MSAQTADIIALRELVAVHTGDGSESLPKDHGYLYFVQAGAFGPVKIGSTTMPVMTRIDSLQTGNPENLMLLGIARQCRQAGERALHKVLKSDRLRGEWFAPSYRVLFAVEFLCDSNGYLPLTADMYAAECDAWRSRS